MVNGFVGLKGVEPIQLQAVQSNSHRLVYCGDPFILVSHRFRTNAAISIQNDDDDDEQKLLQHSGNYNGYDGDIDHLMSTQHEHFFSLLNNSKCDSKKNTLPEEEMRHDVDIFLVTASVYISIFLVFVTSPPLSPSLLLFRSL